MAGHAYVASVAADYALETKLRVGRLDRAIDDAMVDAYISPAEATRIVMYAKRAVMAAEDTLSAAQSTYDRETALVSLLTVKPLNPHIRKVAAERGTDLSEFDAVLDNIRDFPMPDSNDAA